MIRMVKLIERKIEQNGEKYNVTSVVEMDKKEMQDQLAEFENQADSVKAMKEKVNKSLDDYKKKSADEIKKEVIERHEKQVEKFNDEIADFEKEIVRLNEMKLKA